MWRALSASPRVVLGNEWFAGRAADLTPALFERDRFFAPVVGVDCGYDINLHPETSDYVPLAKRRFDDAVYVGDKIPFLYRHLGVIAERFPGAMIVFMLRDPLEVAASYKRRHHDEADAGWTSGSVSEAVRDWNDALAALGEDNAGLTIQVVHYQHFYGDGNLGGLCQDLGISFADGVSVAHARCKFAVRNLMGGRTLGLTSAEIDEVYATADMSAYRNLLAQCWRVAA